MHAAPGLLSLGEGGLLSPREFGARHLVVLPFYKHPNCSAAGRGLGREKMADTVPQHQTTHQRK